MGLLCFFNKKNLALFKKTRKRIETTKKQVGQFSFRKKVVFNPDYLQGRTQGG